MDIDISDFRLSDDNPACHYVFVVIVDVPKYWGGGFSYWERFIDWLLRRRSSYVYFHRGQIVICDTDKDLASPRETPWGAKPGKHNCVVKKFASLEKAIRCAMDIINNV